MRGISVSSIRRAMLRGWTTIFVLNRVGGVLARDFFWIFRGFTDCAAGLTFAQQLGFGWEGFDLSY
jgi:hypothetical protein